MLKEWDKLPNNMRTDEVWFYYKKLKKKKVILLMKRIFDVLFSLLLLIILSPVFVIISIVIVIDTKGGIYYRQERVTQYGKTFLIHKFRTMVPEADKVGSLVTIKNDSRITKAGRVLRKYRLDELPQLIDVLVGNMSFVGTRPEVVKYVNQYIPEMMATLLMPAGITSSASINFKDEDNMLEYKENADEIYLKEILPRKMKYNLKSLDELNLFSELKILWLTVVSVIRK